MYAQDNYVKYNLPYLFSIETRGVMQSATLSNVMSEYTALSVDRFESALDEAVTTNNVGRLIATSLMANLMMKRKSLLMT